jgi:2-methylcitrate dehydratase PrpD
MVETGASIRFPKTGQEGRFSLPFSMALSIMDGELRLEQFSDEKVRSSQIQDIMEKVQISCPKEMTRGMEEPQEVSILLKDGTRHTHRVEKHKGTIENPISDEELFSKFRSCVGTIANTDLTEEIFHYLHQMNKLKNLNKLGEILTFIP